MWLYLPLINLLCSLFWVYWGADGRVGAQETAPRRGFPVKYSWGGVEARERPSERISVPNLGLEWFADKINGICRNNTFTNASYAMVAAPIVAQAAILDGESDQRGHNFKFGTFLG